MQPKDACGCSGVVVADSGTRVFVQGQVAMVWSLGFNLGPVRGHWRILSTLES